MKLYGIGGLGADSRVFRNLRLKCDFVPIEWIDPLQNETIESYSARISEVINTNSEFGILGVSFGGLIAVEISKILKPKLTILISSVETRQELRSIYKLAGQLGILHLVPSFMFNLPRNLAFWLFGANDKLLLRKILDDTDLKFTKWAILQLTSWNNTELIDNKKLKIHGTYDKLIPISKVEGAIEIAGGQHFMIVDRSDEVSAIINDSLLN